MVYVAVATPAGTGHVGWVWSIMNVLEGVLFLLLGDLNLQLAYLGIVIAVDTLLGVVAARRGKSFSIGTFTRKTVEKMAIYAAIIVLSNAMDVVISTPQTFRWIAVVGLLVQEVFSAIGHIEALGYTGLVTILKRLLADQALPAAVRSVLRGEARKRGESK